ncbi:MAG: AprI/Inh family metalloprotease inhibitor [Hyphomicrobiales bacterium]
MKNLILQSTIIGLCGALAACQTTAVAPQLAQPAPLKPAPIAPVSSSTLTPVGAASSAASSAASAAQTATASASSQVQDLQAIPTLSTPRTGVTRVQTVSVSPSIDFGRNAVLGAWNVSTSADTCALNLSLTTWTGGFRASTRKCSTSQLTDIGAWNVAGKQLSLFNRTGGLIARLVVSGDNRFDGTTESGGSSISVFR